MQAPCLLLAQNDEVARRIHGLLHSCAQITRLDPQTDILSECRRHDPALLIIEMGQRHAVETCQAIRQHTPDTLIIALGAMRSDPMIAAADMGVYACETLDVDRLRLQDLVRQAFAHLALIEENRALRQSARPAATGPSAIQPTPPRNIAAKPLGPLTQVFRNAHDINGMLRSVIETVASAAGVSRAGLFAQPRPGSEFVLRAGLRCLSDTESLTIAANDPFVQWMREHAHVAARLTLPHIEPFATQTMIKRQLDLLGAEVVLPLHGHNQLIGWLFVGHLASGMPYDHDALNQLIAISHDVAVMLENGLLTEEAAIQKTLAETVLESIPAGIIAMDTGGSIQWFNDSAGRMLGVLPQELIGRPPNLLGARLADMLTRATRGEITDNPVKWTHPITHVPLSIMTRTLHNGHASLGAVAVLHDLSRERLLRERQERIDRATFWTELAAAISHEVRNPLVAISTFAQLLPERHEDPEFREQFSQLAVEEIGRLNAMIDQVNDFANPSELCFRDIYLADAITQSVKQAKEHLHSGIPVRVTADASLPVVRGDLAALIEAFQHIVSNAIEALQGTTDPAILIVATGGDRTAPDKITIRIQDNGPGIPPKIADKVFSPFCTMKARGIGLGLPIAKRTITDHGGYIDIETGTTGTTVVVVLPIAVSNDPEALHHETAYSSC